MVERGPVPIYNVNRWRYFLFVYIVISQLLFKIDPGDARPDFSEQQYLHWGRRVLLHIEGGYQQTEALSAEGSVVVGLHEVPAAALDISDLSQAQLLLPGVVSEITLSECVVVTISRNKSILAPPSPDLTNPLVPVIFSA